MPLRRSRVDPWEHDRATYRRHEVEPALSSPQRLAARGGTRYDQLDVLFLAFVHLALIFDARPQCELALGTSTKLWYRSDDPATKPVV